MPSLIVSQQGHLLSFINRCIESALFVVARSDRYSTVVYEQTDDDGYVCNKNNNLTDIYTIDAIVLTRMQVRGAFEHRVFVVIMSFLSPAINQSEDSPSTSVRRAPYLVTNVCVVYNKQGSAGDWRR